MNYPIDSIFLNEDHFESYVLLGEERFLENLSKINIFIGANNSGKSRFLRTFFKEENLGFKFKNFDLIRLNQIIEEYNIELSNYSNRYNLKDYLGSQSNILDKVPNVKYIDRNFELDKHFKERLISLQTILKSKIDDTRQYHGNFLKEIGSKYLKQLDGLTGKDFKRYDFKKIYIPILRGLRPISNNGSSFSHDDIYLKRTLKDYFIGKQESDKDIYTGLRLYEDAKALLVGARKDRDRLRGFEEFLSNNFFGGEMVNIIPRKGDDVVHVSIGNIERPIYELGDGIQAIILLTYPLFFNQGKEMKVFIEEPEHYLHLGFQRVFLEVLTKPEFASFQYFITTHSNHFLDITLDIDGISIYTFKGCSESEEHIFLIENVDNEDANILELLGVRNASVFLSNCTVWVEGITDRIYIRKYLEVYQESLKETVRVFKEDTHYSFVEYGGGNITHWSFLNDKDESHSNIAVERLCGKLFLVSDKDGAGVKIDGECNPKRLAKYERHLKLKNSLKDRYYCLNSREIENTLRPSVLKEVIMEYEANKNPQSLVFDSLIYDRYKDQLLGNFIDKQVKGITRSYAAKSGTINDKVNFAKKAVKYINNIEDMTEDAKIMTEMIYNFIKENNS